MVKYADLTPLKQSKELKRTAIWTWDTETKDGLEGKLLYCWSLCTQKGGKNRKPKVYHGFTIDSFFKILYQLNDKDNKQSIYVHNLGFDCRFLIDYCLKHNINFLPIQPSSSPILLFINGLNYRFIDSFQFLLDSQEKAEINWEIDEKLRKINCDDLFNKNYNLWTPIDKKRVVLHNINDTLALQAILVKFRKTYYEISNVDFIQANSLAGLAIKSFRKTLTRKYVNPFIFQRYSVENKRFYYEVNKDKEEFCRKAYYGGRTECFDHNFIKNAIYMDCNSEFPFNMKDKEFPDGIPNWEQNPSKIFESLKDKLSIIEANIIPNTNCKFPPLPNRMNERVCYTNTTQKGIWSSVEIKKAMELGYIVEPIKALIFPNKCRPFVDFVSKFNKIKTENTGGKKQNAKITMNSEYGKHGQKFELESRRLYIFTDESKAMEFYHESIDSEYICENPYLNDFYNKWIVERKEITKSIKTFQMISWAVFITAYSRLHLLNKMFEVYDLGLPIAYTDTDSIVTTNSDLLEISEELGGWKIEHYFNEFKALAPKCYMAELNEKDELVKKYNQKFLLKIKGIRKSKIKEIISSSVSLEEIFNTISNEIELEEQYLPIRASLKLEKKALSSRSMIKKMSLEDKKRITLLDLTTRPITDEDLIEILENE